MKNIMMVHIPKTAGISIKSLVFNNNTYFKKYDFGHHYAWYIKDQMGDEFENAIKFAIVRNPWDRVWSGYSFLTKGTDHRKPTFFDKKFINGLPFNDFIRDLFKSKKYLKYKNESLPAHPLLMFHPQTNWIYKNDNLLVNHIIRFENLKEDMRFFLDDVSMYDKLNQKINVTSKKSYKEIYEKDTVNIIHEMYLKEIETFNYKF